MNVGTWGKCRDAQQWPNIGFVGEAYAEPVVGRSNPHFPMLYYYY